MIDERLIRNYVEGNDPGLIEVLFWHFPEQNEQDPKEPQSG
jgi:hypothetical protein